MGRKVDRSGIMAAVKSSSGPEVAEALASAVCDVKEDHAELFEMLGDMKNSRAEQNARLLQIEQIVAQAATTGGFSGAVMQDTPLAHAALLSLEESANFPHFAAWNSGTCRVKMSARLRAALTNEGGSSSEGGMPSQPARGGIYGPVQRPLRLLDVLPHRPVSADAVEFVQLNAQGEAAEQLAEGDEKAEIEFDGELKRAEIITIAGHETASRQVLSDHAALQSNIDRVLRHKALSRLEHQIINGPGGQGRIHGLLDQGAAFIPTMGATPADIIGEALVRQANQGYQPDLVIMNPLDWFAIQLTRKADDEESYVFGSPTVPVPPSLWNTGIIATPSMPEGKAMTLDTAHIDVLDREEPSVMLSNSHKDYFTRNLVLILGELRAGLEVRDAFAVYRMDLAAPSI